MLFVTARNSQGRFYRAGLGFTKAGRVIDPDALGERAMARITAEPNLHVRPATPEEIAAVTPEIDDGDVIDALMAAIAELPAEAFGKGGDPNMSVLRDAAGLPEATTDQRDEAMDRLRKAGFEVPAATGSA